MNEMNPNIINELRQLYDTTGSYSVLYPNVSITYPIQPWTFWYKNSTAFNPERPWEESLVKIDTVRDVAHLWKILNHILQPSIEHTNMSLFVFVEQSLPVWEHETNNNAGRWIIILKHNDNLPEIWNNLVLKVLGDEFSKVADDINGLGVHVRSGGSKITLWTTKITLENYKNILEIGALTRKVIGPMLKRMHYFTHSRLL